MEVPWRDFPTFPQFGDLTLEDKSLFESGLSRFPPSISEFTFTNLFIWRHRYPLKVNRFNDFICLLSDQEKDPVTPQLWSQRPIGSRGRAIHPKRFGGASSVC
jgi:hypothetical protein